MFPTEQIEMADKLNEEFVPGTGNGGDVQRVELIRIRQSVFAYQTMKGVKLKPESRQVE